MTQDKDKISVIIPVYNESESISLLIDEIQQVMLLNKLDYEIIVVNDGSKDKTYEVLTDITNKVNELIVINLRKNYGQTAALEAGFDNASGQIVDT